MQSIQTLTLIGKVLIRCVLHNIIFIKLDIAEYFLLFNHILLLGKFYIYPRKYQNGIPSLQGFIARTRRIAGKRDKLDNHFRKWEKLKSVFTNE